MNRYDIIIVGGGAAGLLAAGFAAASGRDVIVLEKMARAARKLRITGKGRCNLTNMAETADFIDHFGKDGRFLRQAFSRFFNEDLINFFESIGVPCITERGGRVFPKSGKAPEVVDALIKWAKKSGVTLETTATVSSLIIENDTVSGVKLKNGDSYFSKKVIVATGGKSYPLTGSTGDGYSLAKSAGHNIVPPRPALIPLISETIPKKMLKDLNLKNINATLLIDGKRKKDIFGELVFTDKGVSGPVILTLSGIAVDALDQAKKVTISIDLKPALDETKLDTRLLRDFDKNGKINFRTFLNSLLPMKLIPVCIDSLNIPKEKLLHQISAKERRRLGDWLKHFKLTITGYHPIDEAIVTAGGINLKEIDPKTMESKLLKNLYFAGEILNLNGDTGGYNLQAAFSTGYLAGTSAALSEIDKIQ